MAAGALDTVALGIGLGLAKGLIALVLVVLATTFLAGLCTRQIGGQTGDVIGCLEHVNEVVILLVAAARVMHCAKVGPVRQWLGEK